MSDEDAAARLKRAGPDPERLKLDEDDWKKAVRRALRRQNPPEKDVGVTGKEK